MESFIVHEDNTAYQSIDGALFSKDTSELLYYPADNPRTSYSIPNGVNTIRDGAFNGAGNLKSITVPGTVETISSYLFNPCEALEEVILENGVSVIESSAFSWCENLAKVYLPISVSEIQPGAFSFCESLTTVYYSGTESLWKTVSIGKANDYFVNADYVFSDQDSLQAGLSTQTGELRICGVDEDTETVMVAFYDQNGKLERIETFTAEEVASGVMLSEVGTLQTIRIMQVGENLSPVANVATP